MALSGLVGAGAAASLEEMLAKRELARRQALAEQQQQFENQVRVRNLEGNEQYRTAALEATEQSRRDRNNQFGLEQMGRDREVLNEETAQREFSGRLERIAQDPNIPEEVRTLISLDPKNLQRVGVEDVKSPATRAREKAEAEAAELDIYGKKKEIDARFREPSTPSGEWVIRNGQPIKTTQVQPGDRPYDAVAARQPAEGAPSAYSAERAARTIASVDSLLKKVNRTTTGMGSLISGIPESDARNFAAELNTLKSNIAFNELAEMRAASKTGGALGAVSERELGLLESSLGALDPGQSPEQIKAQLQQIKESVQRYQQARGGQMMQPSHEPGAVQRKPIPGIPGAEAELRDGKWVRVK